MRMPAMLKAVLWLGAGAGFHWLAFAPMEWAVAAWFAPFCWLMALDDLPTPRRRFYGVFVASYAAMAVSLFWLWSIFRLLTIILWIIPAFYFGLWGLVSGARFPRWPAANWLWPAAAWCGLEYFRSEWAPLCFAFLGLGYSQANAVGSLAAPLIGAHGLSFLVVLWATLAARHVAARRTNPSLVPALLLMVPFISIWPVFVGESIPIGQVRLQQLAELSDPEEVARAEKPGQSADLIVWPEYTGHSDPFERSGRWLLRVMQAQSAATQWGVVFGAIDNPETQRDARDYFNTVFFIDPKGSLVGRAVKNQPVQLTVDGKPARGVTVLDVPGSPPSVRSDASHLRMGVGICYDGSFQRFSRRMAARGADFLVFPTYNAAVWGPVQFRQHQRMFQMRAAETRLAVLVAAISGPTFVAHPNGAASECLPFLRTAAMDASIPRPGRRPPFVLFGWLIGPVCALATGAIMLALLANRWRTGRPARPLEGQSDGNDM